MLTAIAARVARASMRAWPLGLTAVLSGALFFGSTAREHPDGRAAAARGNSTASASRPDQEKQERMREGTKVEKVGYFRATGDRVTFYTGKDVKTRYRGLENLMLERIGQAIEDNPGQLEWNVIGVVTEYRGANYLLVTHAVLTASSGTQNGSLSVRGRN